MRHGLAIGIFGALLAIAPVARPCVLAAPTEHQIDPASADRVPPTLVRAEVRAVARGLPPRGGGCGSTTSSCDDLGWVRVVVEATDDTTIASEIGFLFELESGTLPAGMSLPSTPVRRTGEEIHLVFADGAVEEQEPISFVLRITAVDRAGNKSASSSVAVNHDGREEWSCGFGKSGIRVGPTMLIVAALFAWLRRANRR
jgi:hypothetical protein